MQILWLPESWPWPLPMLLRLLGRSMPGGSRLSITLNDAQALGAMTIHGEDGRLLLRLADQLNTRTKHFRLPPLPEDENLTLRDQKGQILYERIVHTRQTEESTEASGTDDEVCISDDLPQEEQSSPKQPEQA